MSGQLTAPVVFQRSARHVCDIFFCRRSIFALREAAVSSHRETLCARGLAAFGQEVFPVGETTADGEGLAREGAAGVVKGALKSDLQVCRPKGLHINSPSRHTSSVKTNTGKCGITFIAWAGVCQLGGWRDRRVCVAPLPPATIRNTVWVCWNSTKHFHVALSPDIKVKLHP